MTLGDAICLLKAAGISFPENDARVIFKELGGIADHSLFLRETKTDSPVVTEAIKRRADGEPLQYIVGRVGFYREEYAVCPDCLIPREDTEILVDYAVKNLPVGADFLDLCTGSGCIAISTLKNTVGTVATAVDISKAALSVARKNAESIGVSERLTLLRLDLISDEAHFPEECYDAVLSNPPYVTLDEYEALDRELMHEPKIALTDGGDGSLFYKKLVPLAKGLIKKDGFIAMEIGSSQAALLRSIAKEYDLSCEILTDLSGNDRVAVLKKI